MNVCVRVRRTGQAGTTAYEVPLDATRAHSERGGWRVAHFPTLGMIWMESGRVGDGLPQGERSINPPAVHARMHKHTDTCRHAIIQHLHTRSLQCCFLLWFFFPRTWDDTQPHEHTSAHEWWHCQRLLCSTLFAVSFEGPTLPILPAPPPPIASSHLLMFLDTSEQLTQSFLSFFFSQSVHPYHYFSTSVCTQDLAMTIFILRKRTIQVSSFIYCILFYLILSKLEKKKITNWFTSTLVFF